MSTRRLRHCPSLSVRYPRCGGARRTTRNYALTPLRRSFLFTLVGLLLPTPWSLNSAPRTAHALSMSESPPRQHWNMPSVLLSRRGAFSAGMVIAASLVSVPFAGAFSAPQPPEFVSRTNQAESFSREVNEVVTVAYRPMSVEMDKFGISVPVAMWYPVTGDESDASVASTADANRQWNNDVPSQVTYDHRISVRKIGELLAGWEFIPKFVSKDFQLSPTLKSGRVVDGLSAPIPSTAPVLVLAHGYLGSRFDLSHLAESLAQQGFVCISAEYPESLAASYPRMDGLDRSVITDAMLDKVSTDWGIKARSFGIVGHSLGCGTAMSTGDDTWTRVLIAGFPRTRDGATIPGSVLFLTSMNDGAVSLSRFGGKSSIPADYEQLDATKLGTGMTKIPRRAALVFDGPDAPNHISYLADGVNTAMIDLLSPLLPLAQAMSIPVLDFDKYKESRDSDATAEVVIPLVTSYLKEQMKL